MLTDDVSNSENARIVIIMKEMSAEIVNSEFADSKERIQAMFQKFKGKVETKLGDALLDSNQELFEKLVDIMVILKMQGDAIKKYNEHI